MSKERLSRIDYLRDKLSQMGHPPANRIVWEKELEELLKQSKPTKIKGSFKPRKCNHVAWNRKLLQGYKSDESGWLPTGYFRCHANYVIPPYLRATWKAFLAGNPVYGKYWFNSLAATAQKGQQASGKHWGSKKSKRQVHGNPEVRAEFQQDVDEFFKLMPCVPFTECRDRFPKGWLDGDFEQVQREAREKIIQQNLKNDAFTEKMRLEQWKRVEAGRKAYEAAHPGKHP